MRSTLSVIPVYRDPFQTKLDNESLLHLSSLCCFLLYFIFNTFTNK